MAFLELGEVDGASTAAAGDLLCMAAPLLMGLSWHLLGEHMRTFPQDAVMAVMAVMLGGRCFCDVFLFFFDLVKTFGNLETMNDLRILGQYG